MELENGTKKSSGVAKAGLTLGIIGTSLAGLMAANNHGWFNGPAYGCANGFYGGYGYANGFYGPQAANTRAEVEQSVIADLDSEVAKLKSMRYTDQVGIELYKEIIATSNQADQKIRDNQKDAFAYIIELDKKTALNEQAQKLNREYDTMARDYQFALMDSKLQALNNRIDCCNEKQCMITNFNKQLNELADASIISYVNSNFYPGKMVIPASAICPPVVTQ